MELKKKIIKNRDDYEILYEKGKIKSSKSTIHEWQTLTEEYINKLIDINYRKDVEVKKKKKNFKKKLF